MAAVTSHKDTERKGVGVTAHFVAALRATESARSDALINDPYAAALAGELGNSRFILKEDGSYENEAVPLEKRKVPQGLVQGVGIRTRKIDDEMKAFLKANPDSPKQICVFGAGLDSRPWRITLEGVELGSIKYFELDFPELFLFKLPVLEEAGAKTAFSYVSVQTDLSLTTWTDVLANSGFDPALPTFWLMEGFTGYLTEDEFHNLFAVVTTRLSAAGSRLVATFLTPATVARIHLHRFTPAEPLQEVYKHKGWTKGAQDDIRELGREFGREWSAEDNSMAGYCIVTADYAV